VLAGAGRCSERLFDEENAMTTWWPPARTAIRCLIALGALLLAMPLTAPAKGPAGEITFDCDPSQLEGHLKATCLAKRLEEGRRLFEEETFGGNGRTCVTCHSVKTGTFSPEDARKRLKKNPDDPLFVGDGQDDPGPGTSRITEHATVRITIPLPPRVKLLDNPTATSVDLFRGTPTTRNTPSLQPVFMYDGRDTTLEKQALGAVHAHAQNTVEPTPLQLQLIAEFQRTARFFSSPALFRFANGGPPPKLPDGVTASEKRGRAMFDNVPITPGSTRGLCAMCHSGPMLDVSNEFNIFLPVPGVRFFGVHVSERNKLDLPTYTFIVDDTDIIVTPDPGLCLTSDLPPDEFPPELFGPGGPFPLVIACNLFKTPTLWGVKHTAPYFHDNSAKTLEEVAEQYTVLFQTEAGITLTPQDEADIVAFLKLV
jgi:cytochrome c peroxidase